MILLALAAVYFPAQAEAETANARAETARLEWVSCLNSQAKRIHLKFPQIAAPDIADVAKRRCYKLGMDFKATLPDVARIGFKAQGLKAWSEELPYTVADDVFSGAEGRALDAIKESVAPVQP